MKLRTIASGLLIATLFYVCGAAIDLFLFGRELQHTSNLGMIVAGFYVGAREDRRRRCAALAQPPAAPTL